MGIVAVLGGGWVYKWSGRIIELIIFVILKGIGGRYFNFSMFMLFFFWRVGFLFKIRLCIFF